MQTNTRKLVLEKSPEEVYKFIKNPRNYLSEVDYVTVSDNSASFSVPGFGNIKANIINSVENEKIVIYSKEINTSLEVKLSKVDDNKTIVIITSNSDPRCGFFKNKLILFSIPSLLNSLVDNLKSQKI